MNPVLKTPIEYNMWEKFVIARFTDSYFEDPPFDNPVFKVISHLPFVGIIPSFGSSLFLDLYIKRNKERPATILKLTELKSQFSRSLLISSLLSTALVVSGLVSPLILTIINFNPYYLFYKFIFGPYPNPIIPAVCRLSLYIINGLDGYYQSSQTLKKLGQPNSVAT